MTSDSVRGSERTDSCGMLNSDAEVEFWEQSIAVVKKNRPRFRGSGIVALYR